MRCPAYQYLLPMDAIRGPNAANRLRLCYYYGASNDGDLGVRSLRGRI